MVSNEKGGVLTKRAGPDLPMPILVIACNRVDYLKQTLNKLLE